MGVGRPDAFSYAATVIHSVLDAVMATMMRRSGPGIQTRRAWAWGSVSRPVMRGPGAPPYPDPS